MDVPDIPLGRRIAVARQQRGLSRRALGDLVGRSAEWIRQVERGDRGVDRLSVLRRLAGVLHLSGLGESSLGESGTGVEHRPEPPVPRIDLGPLRVAVLDLPGSRPSTSGADVLAAWTGWHDTAAPYTDVLRRLPPILRRDASPCAYRLAATVLGRLGDNATSLVAARSAVTAAADACGCVRAAAIGAYADALAHHGVTGSAESAVREALGALDRCGCAARSAVAGRLHLVGARVATAGYAAHAARTWLAGAARWAAEALAEPDPRYAFTSADVDAAAVRVALRLGDLPEALRLSHRLDPAREPARARRSRGYVTLARVHGRARNAPAALLALGKAEQACPEELRLNPYARQTLSDLLTCDDTLVHADAWTLAARTALH